jgi:hypothetical protein
MCHRISATSCEEVYPTVGMNTSLFWVLTGLSIKPACSLD